MGSLFNTVSNGQHIHLSVKAHFLFKVGMADQEEPFPGVSLVVRDSEFEWFCQQGYHICSP